MFDTGATSKFTFDPMLDRNDVFKFEFSSTSKWSKREMNHMGVYFNSIENSIEISLRSSVTILALDFTIESPCLVS